MLFELRIEKVKKPTPITLKGINKSIENENGHKQRGFYSESCDAGKITECT